MARTATKKVESREEETARKLREIGQRAYESIAEMVAKLDANELDDDGEDSGDPDETAREKARDEIIEDALSCEVRSGWYTPGSADNAPEEFCLLLGTGGPAVRIRGELDQHMEPSRAWLETQDWGMSWTQYFDVSQEVLLAYSRCFYFGKG